MNPQERLLSTAAAEIGYLEKKSNSQLDDKTANAGSANYTKYARDLDAVKFFNTPKNGYSWCAVFVAWCFFIAFGLELALKLLCQSLGSCGAGVKAAAQYYKGKGRFHTSGPQPGDQVFFVQRNSSGFITSWLHTGLVDTVEGGYVYTIEGNTSGASGVISNGGGVCRKRYALTDTSIGGYGRPDWSLVPKPEKENSMKELTKTYKTLNDIPAYWREDISWLMERRYLLGDEYGDLNLSYDATRMLVVLARVARNMSKAS